NGAFFTALFARRNETVFGYLVVIALVHAVLSGAVAYSGALSGVRAGGETNPIPFSEMLPASIGLVAIVAAARMNGRGKVWRPLALAAFLGVSFLALVLTGTRGTLVVVLPLIVLVAAAMKMRVRALHLAGALVVTFAVLALL